MLDESLSYAAAGKLLAAETQAQQAAAAAGCDTLPQLAALQLSESAAPSSPGRHPSASAGAGPSDSQQQQPAAADAAGADNSSRSLDLRQLAREAAAARECIQQLEATRQWAATKESGLRVQYHHDRGTPTCFSSDAAALLQACSFAMRCLLHMYNI